jgi:predicted GTPase
MTEETKQADSRENNADDKNRRNIFDSLQEEIMKSDLSEAEKNRRLSALLKASGRKVNLMLVGTTGSGKSSTINAMFDMNVAKVGVGVDPETKDIEKYELGNLTIWDTPGLGDGVDADRKHVEQIVRKLSETGEDGNLLIDLVLVVLDASSKDLAVPYDVINNTLIPALGKNNIHRILIALNQSDMAMKGRHWDDKQNAPDSVLKGFLTKKVNSVKQRILEATGVTVEPIYYCAGYTDDDGVQQNPYNLSKLLYYILMAVPSEKRLLLADKLNEDETNWAADDGEMDYRDAIKKSFWNSVLESVGKGAEKGAVTGGCILGIPGMVSGGLVGSIIGGLHGLIVKPIMKAVA